MRKSIKIASLILCIGSCFLSACKEKTPTPSSTEIVIDNNGKTTFAFEVNSLELLVGDTFTLKPKTYSSDEGLKWYSSDKNIVSVDRNGNLEALEQGNVVITAYDSIAVGSISVSVSAPNNKLSISLSTNQLTLGVGSQYACRVSADVKLDGVSVNTLTVNVLKKDESEAGVSSFAKESGYYKFTGNKVGTAVYSFTVSNGELTVGANLYISVIEVE